jgi:Glycosyltransferase
MNVQVIYGNTVRASLYAALAARLARRPFIWHMRDFWLSESRPRHLWPDHVGKRLLCHAAARVIANSQATARHLPCPGRVSVVYNGIEVEKYDPSMDGTLFRDQYGIPRDVPLVGTVGRLRPWKGHDRFLRALARVRRQRPDVWGVVVGGTPFQVKDDYPQRLQMLTRELELAEQVVFTGHLDDVRPALAAMDVFVHAGDPEPFGLVVVEAMAMARPVVAFAHGALPEIVVDGETGRLVPSCDEHALAKAIEQLLGNVTAMHRMGWAGYQRVQSIFRIEQTAQHVETICLQVAT